MKKKKVSLSFFINAMIFFILLGMLLTIAIGEDKIVDSVSNIYYEITSSEDVSEDEQEIIDNCDNENLFDTAQCLNSEIKDIYKYKINNEKSVRDFDELVKKGGDCNDWSYLYKKLGRELGFYSKVHTLYTDKDSTPMKFHVFATISNENGYCIFDARDYECHIFLN